MRIVVDLNRCLGYAQCVPLAPDVLQLQGEEALAYDPNPDDSQRQRVARAPKECSVASPFWGSIPELIARLSPSPRRQDPGARRHHTQQLAAKRSKPPGVHSPHTPPFGRRQRTPNTVRLLRIECVGTASFEHWAGPTDLLSTPLVSA